MVPELSEDQLDAGRQKAIERRKRDSLHRMRQVKALMDLGMTQAEIGRELGVSRQAVNATVKRIRQANA